MPNTGTVYLPPPRPVARVLNTDEYVKPTSIYFHAQTERLLLVGHPLYDVADPTDPNKITVPKVSGNQYRVLRMQLPDPNKMAFVDKGIYNPDHERLAWRLAGLEIDRGGPLGIGASGHPLYNKYVDTENPTTYPNQLEDGKDYRVDLSFDPKQVQMFIVGCEPATGLHWDAKTCTPNLPNGSCPPLELVHSVIQDGEMCDIGLGAMNFAALQQDRASAPMDIVAETCKWPDFNSMSKDIYGNSVFFYGVREQLYARHFYIPAAGVGDALPDNNFYWTPNRNDNQEHGEVAPYVYGVIPSGSLNTSDAQLFNKPYWVQRAQGNNNAVCWNNNLFLTIVDNTRNNNFIVTVYKEGAVPENYNYKQNDFKAYLRHAEEYEVELVLQLVKIPLTPDTLAHLQVMNPSILKNWQLGFVPPPPSGLEDEYRYIRSMATFCTPDTNTSNKDTEEEDPYKNYTFWNIDLSDKFSTELSQTALGRRFLYQYGLLNGRKRSYTNVTTSSVTTKRAVKRRKTRK